MARGGKFSSFRTGNRDLDNIQQSVADTFDQLEDARRGLLVGSVKSTPSNLQLSEHLVAVYTGPGGHTFTLPLAALRGMSRGQFLAIGNLGKGPLTVAASRAETVNGLPSVRLVAGQSAVLFSDGHGLWQLVGRDEGRDWGSYKHAGGSSLERWYYAACDNAATLVTGAPTVNVLRAFPFIAPARGGTLDRIAFNVTTIAAGNARVGLYENVTDEANLYPGKLLLDGGSVSTNSTGVKAATGSIKLRGGGLYWLAHVCGTLAATLQALNLANCPHVLGVANTLSTTPNVGVSVAFTFNPFPDPFPAGGADITAVPVPALAYRMAA